MAQGKAGITNEAAANLVRLTKRKRVWRDDCIGSDIAGEKIGEGVFTSQ